MSDTEPRFWVLTSLPTAEWGDGFDTYPYGDDTVGIVDEQRGGIVAYVHKNNATEFLAAIRNFHGEV